MTDAVTVEFDASSAFRGLDEIVRASNEAVRPAAQAGADVFYEEVKARAPIAKRARTIKKTGRVILPGALKASIYQAFSEDNSDATTATYHISWNFRKAPHGHLVEFGTVNAPAHPFLRPSYDTMKDRALKVTEAFYTFSMQGALAT